eukprot:evm.model.scf_553.2 EVM.evm.TU.scf_553.2   scf_553:24405-31154(-)
MTPKRRMDEPMDDEIDAFAESRDRVSLDAIGELRRGRREGDVESDDDEEIPVLDISDESDSETEGGSDVEDGESEGTSEEELVASALRQGGKVAEIAKAARAIRTEIQRHKGLDSEDSGSEEGGEPAWGGIDDHYGDDLEFERDPEARRAEEEEMYRLQQQRLSKLSEQDFGLLSDSEAESGGDQEGPLESGTRHAAATSQDVSILKRGKELGAVSIDDIPEVAAMCAELKESLHEVRKKITPLLKEVRAGGLCDNEGLNYLEAKQLLLLHYCLCILFFLLLKLEGKSVKDHPVVVRLVEIRANLEKIRPIDRRLQYQLDKLLRAAKMAKEAEEAEEAGQDAADLHQCGPRPDMLVPKAADTANGNDGGVYRPPRLNSTALEERDKRKFKAKKLKNTKKRAARRAVQVQEMAAELAEAPEALPGTPAGMETAGAIRTLRKMREKENVEKELMPSSLTTGVAKRRLKVHHGAGLSGRVFNDFADEVADMVDSVGRIKAQHALSQKFGIDLAPKHSLNPKTGDEDLPTKPSLLERRMKHQSNQLRKGVLSRGKPETQENGSSQEARNRPHKSKVAEKKLQTSKPPRAPMTVDGPRAITKEIRHNRGLMAYRRKDTKNPRKKQRVRYERAVSKRKGQAVSVKKGGFNYGGEKTGINANISKGVRFQ